MTIKSWLFLALLAPMTVVGCASEGSPSDPDAANASDELVGTGPNAWQVQGQTLDCTTSVASKVTKTSRRHVFTFEAGAGQKTTFTLSGTWPAGYGARIYVTDPSGKVIATEKQDGASKVSVVATFATAGKHTVSVSPIKYQQVAKTYSYTLSAACESSLQCASVAVLWDGSTTPTSYLQNVSSASEAAAFFAQFPANVTLSTTQRDGACDQSTMCTTLYKPVCGVIRNEAPHTFSNACAFGAALGTDAGHTAGQGTKGYVVNEGECAPVCDYSDPDKHYVAQSAEACKAVKFACQKGQTPFFNECGCGCEGTPAPVCDYEQPTRHYVAQSPEKCQVIKYACPKGQSGFSDECGCGCEETAPVCDYEQPSKHYVAQSPEACKAVKFACQKNQSQFFDDCGCGCEDAAAPVCDYNEPGKHYVAQSPDTCKLVKFACQKGQTPFFNECGCGCAE